MRTVVALARCSHFGPTVAVTSFTTLLALGAGMPLSRALVVAAAALAGQLSIGWSNDWLDRDRDRRPGGQTSRWPVATSPTRPSFAGRWSAVGACAA